MAPGEPMGQLPRRFPALAVNAPGVAELRAISGAGPLFGALQRSIDSRHQVRSDLR
jgi:hypothetical protein